MAIQNINEESVKKFKSDVVGACPSLVTLQEQYIARSIPQSVFESVFRNVFNGDSQLARDVVYNRFDRIKDDIPEREVERIETLLPASIKIANTIRNKIPMLLISDIDNDGSLSQAMTMELGRLTGHKISVSPKDYDPANHGFSLAQINDWAVSQHLGGNDKFLVMVTDLGTNQRDDQLAFLEKYPNAELIVADHHKPDIDMMMRNDDSRALLVSPFVKGSIRLGLRGGGGVSGGYLSYKMFKHALLNLRQTNDLELTDLDFENRLEPLKSMGKAANLLDRVECDIRLKPLHEKEVKKALDVSSLTNKGRIIGKWLSVEQVSNIKELEDLIGEEAVESLIEIRKSLMEQNHIAWSLNELMPKIVSFDDDDNEEEKIKNVANEVAVLLNTVAMEESADVNYIELLRPHVFNLNYENQFEGTLKKSWLSIAKKMMRDVGKLEKDILKQIRDYQLVKEISYDFITITQSASHSVSKVFTTKQLASAYHSLTKPVNMNVSRSTLGEVVLSYRTEVPISELMSNVESVLPGVDYSIRGHDNVGGLSLKLPMGTDPKSVLKTLAENLNSTAKRAIDNKPLPEAFEVKAIHLPILKEMLKKMRVDMSPESEPVMLMKISPNMTFEDTKTLERQTVSRLVERKEWETTTESLDFAMTSSLILPNQALKTIANDGFEGALKISLLPNGTYIANKAVTGAQLRQMEVSTLKIPLQKEQAELKHEYLTRFADPDVIKVKAPRKAVVNALNFTGDGESVFHNTEATLLGVLNETGKDSYVVLDVEAKGGGNAQCYQLGLAIYEKVKNSGHLLSRDEFRELAKLNSDKINNFRKIEDNYLVNEKLELSLVSLVISKDGSEPIRISFKDQNLTNIDQDFLDEVGMSAALAQEKLLAAVSDIGEFIIQAHNLPYDDKIVSVNFPEFYEVMSKAVHLDTAPLAMRNQIAYTNVQVNTIDGVEFFNAEHEGYNLSTLMDKEESFDFPSIKGGVVLQVRGDVVQRLDLETRITTKLKMTRDELAGTLKENMAPLKKPKYGIAKLLKMAAIHDLISRQPLKKVKKINFESMGSKELPSELWDHFQEYYSYDLTPAQNVAKFSVLPDVQEHLGSSEGMKFDSLSDVDPRLLEARNLGSGGSYDPEKKLRSKKEQALHEEKVSSFSLSDVLNANAINFVKANPENAERFARAWLYELVLDHYEPSRKTMPKSFIDGVSNMTGVMDKMVSVVFDETYIYKNSRNIQTYVIHEPHSNIGLYSDTILEVNVFNHMLEVKLKNPFLTGEYALKYDINPAEPMVKAMVKQAAESTVRKDLKITLREVLDDDVVNNYSAKQLDQFSQDGISVATTRAGIAKMKCKTLSSNDTAIHIELPNFSANNGAICHQAKGLSLKSKLKWP